MGRPVERRGVLIARTGDCCQLVQITQAGGKRGGRTGAEGQGLGLALRGVDPYSLCHGTACDVPTEVRGMWEALHPHQ